MGAGYQIPCKDCPCIYTGVVERRYEVSEKEHKRDVKTVEEKYTRSRKKDSLTEVHPSIIMDHVAKENHAVDCERCKVLHKRH